MVLKKEVFRAISLRLRMTSSTQIYRVSPGTIISVFSVFLFCAGFARVEWKLSEQNSRITALERGREAEDGLVHEDRGKDETQYNLHLTRLMRSRRDKNSADNSTESLESLLKKLLKTLQERNMQRCPIRPHFCFRGALGKPGSKGDRGTRGRRGPRGKTGRRGAAGPQGPRGRTGKQGMMGPAGRKGDKGDKGSQGIMGPTGLKGEKGEKGLQGLTGLKGDPGKSISVPSVVISPPSQTANENSVAILYCSATGNPKPIIKWEKINGVLPENRYEVSPSGQLKLKQIRLGDAGLYQCEARNILGVLRAKSLLVVRVPPQISLKPGPTYAEENETASLPKCHVKGNPPPKVKWSKVLGQLPSERSLSNNGSLSLQRVQKSDSGLYTCRASNLQGTQAVHTQLVVVSPPQFVVRPPSTVDALVGQTLQINCSADGDPRPLVTWRRAGGQLPLGRASLVNGNLILRRVKTIDSGTYICRATYNPYLKGQEATVTVNVKECTQAPAVGAASGGRLPHSSFNALSFFDRDYLPQNGRLNRPSYAWCQKSDAISPNEYLQVDFGATYWVCAVATQGNRHVLEWTTKYKLKISNDGVSWNTYQQNGSDKEFNGNTDQNSVVRNNLPTLPSLRFIRFYPTARHTHPCLRVEIYGLRADG